MKGLTMNEEPNVCCPYASRDHYDGSLPIPNSNAGGAHERSFGKIAASPRPKCRRQRTCGGQSRMKRQQRLGIQRTKKKREEDELPNGY